MKNLTFITGSDDKVQQLSTYLKMPIKKHKLDLDEIQSVNLREVVTQKAKDAYEILKTPVIVDDVALTINSMGKLPGPLIKFFIQELGTQGICDLVNVYKDRSAHACTAIGYCDGETVEVFIGKVVGKIAKKSVIGRGFGWDQIVIPNGHNKTLSQLDADNYDKVSPRKKALIKFENFLKNK